MDYNNSSSNVDSKYNNMATSSGNKSSSKNSSNGNKGTINGKSYEIVNGNISSKDALSNEEIEEIYKNMAQASNGGRTPSNIDDGKAMIVHSNEMISSAEDTKKFDETHDLVTEIKPLLDSIYSNINVAQNSGIKDLLNYNVTGLSKYTNGLNPITNEDNSNNVEMNNYIYNYNSNDVAINEAKIEKILTKVIGNQKRRYK